MLTFSERYLRPEAIQEDAPRMRIQLHALFVAEVKADLFHPMSEALRFRSGAEVPWLGPQLNWAVFFKQSPIRDVLDMVTVVFSVLKIRSRNDNAARWLQGVTFIFNVQNLKYRIAGDGSVFLRVDETFEAHRAATLARLDAPRYQGVRAEFDGAFRALAAEQPNGKQAIRSIFEACEVVFKLMFPPVRRVGLTELVQNLAPFVAQHYAADRPAQQAADKLVQSFIDWVASAQFYRHGQAQEEPNEPPLEIAVAILSEGASHLRWLIHLDQVKLTEGAKD